MKVSFFRRKTVPFLYRKETCMKQTNTKSMSIRKLAFAGMFLALALLLPFLTGQIPQFGSMLLPMHIPVLLCGFICGWPWGLAVGAVAPLLRFALCGMPPLYPIGAAMALELAAYGLLTGLLYRKLPKKLPMLYLELVLAMIGGRIVWGAAQMVMAGLQHTAFPLKMFWSGAVLNAIPGIICQLVLIPPIVAALTRARLSLNAE